MFNLRHVSVEILKNPEIVETKVTGDFDDLIDSAKFNYGSNTLFTSYEKNKENIENANPFIKVERMVRRFPNKMTIYVSGRIPEVVVEDSENSSKWYILDIDMKVLDVIGSTAELGDDLYYGLPVVSGTGLKGLTAGSFVSGQGANIMVDILDGIYGKDQSPSSVMSDITMDLSNQKAVVTLRDRDDDNGATITINGFNFVKEKVYAAYLLYKNNYENDDINWPNKNDLDLIVPENFVPTTNEKVTIHDRRNDI